VEVEIGKTDAGIERYLRAFESGSMPVSLCGSRVGALGDRLSG